MDMAGHTDMMKRWIVWAGLGVGLAAISPARSDNAVAQAGMPAHSQWTDLGKGVLKDAATGLQWTQSDSGRDLDWEAAKAWCAGKGGGWRLPELKELMAIYAGDGSGGPGTGCAGAVCRVSPLFKLTSTWYWSGTPVTGISDADELAWGILLVNGAQTQALRFVSYGSRTLCVRSQT